MQSDIQQILLKLTELSCVKALYLVPNITETEKQLFLVLTSKVYRPHPPSSLTELFQEHPSYLYRVYDEAYAIEQLEKGNLFFIHALRENFLQYRKAHTLPLHLDFEEAFEKAADFFNKEHHKALDFQEGAQFYIAKKNYAQAAFMLHQAFELAFRAVELITMGKEKVCHRIRNHLEYVHDFIPELGNLFALELPEEQQLLDDLDTAYRNVRYTRDYHISLEAIERLQELLPELLSLVVKQFTHGYEDCKKAVEKTSSKKDLSMVTIEKSLRELIYKKYEQLNPHLGTFYLRQAILVEGPMENFHNLTHLLKVCVLALKDTGDYFSKTIPQPDVNIQQTLEFVIELLPYEEMEFLEQLIEAAGGLQALLEKEGVDFNEQ